MVSKLVLGMYMRLITRTIRLLTPFLLSSYDLDYLLALQADNLCPDQFPEGQDCALPLRPGVYGGVPSAFILPGNIPEEFYPYLKGSFRTEITLTDASGDLLVCAWSRIEVDHVKQND